MPLLRKLTSLIIFLPVFLLYFPQPVQAKPHYNLIINQVRGHDCCQPGSIDHLEQQLNSLEQYNLTANFVLRYDALSHPETIQLLQNSPHQLGGYLEIIPSLAQTANVDYQDDESNWYQAQHTYLVGYAQPERKKTD